VKLLATVIFTAVLFVQSAKKGPHIDAGAPQLPAPEGHFTVGRVMYHWTDLSRPEALSGKTGAHREIMVYVWYPAAEATKPASPAPYWPDFKAAKAALSDNDFKDMLDPAGEEIERAGLPITHAIEGASMSRDKAEYPVLIFSHGWGMQSPFYTAALEDLASHGYVVAAVDHPYDTGITVFPDGRVVKFAQDKYDAAAKKPNELTDYIVERIEVMATDVRFVIDQLSRYNSNAQLGSPFAGHLHLSRLGAFGHSIGGMTSARACQIDVRIRACIDEDSLLNGSPFSVTIPQQPFLLFSAVVADLFSEKKLHPSDETLARLRLSRGEYDEELKKQQNKQNQQFADIKGGAYRVMLFDLPGFTHQSFSDLPLLAADHDQAKWDEARYNFQIVQAYIRGFFDKYLKDNRNTLLDAESWQDKRVRVDRFGPAKVHGSRSPAQ
jgi:pimeloyl-ACP methyl ester carboxylesterase